MLPKVQRPEDGWHAGPLHTPGTLVSGFATAEVGAAVSGQPQRGRGGCECLSQGPGSRGAGHRRGVVVV